MVNDENKSFIEELKKKIAPIVYDTHREIVINTPVITGRLRNSVVIEETEDGFLIGTSVEYAPFVELDVGPHIIEPVNAKALRFQMNGETVFAKKVHHPGSQGHHMFLRGVGYFEQRMNDLSLD